MKWTKEKPTKEGFYWYKEYESWKTKTVIEIRPDYQGRLSFNGWPVFIQDGVFAGPIEEPEEDV